MNTIQYCNGTISVTLPGPTPGQRLRAWLARIVATVFKVRHD